jgi:hypothetical protein
MRDNKSLKLGEKTAAVYRMIRDVIPFQNGDAYWKAEVDSLQDYFFGQRDFQHTFYNNGLTKL